MGGRTGADEDIGAPRPGLALFALLESVDRLPASVIYSQSHSMWLDVSTWRMQTMAVDPAPQLRNLKEENNES